MRAHPVSVCIITYNEEGNLRECLESVRWADEIVVVDSKSRDRTVEIAREFTQKVIVRDFPGHVEQKNFCLAQAEHDWVLSLDADERVSPRLQEEIDSALSSGDVQVDGFSAPRKTFYMGKWIRHGGWYPDYKLRLFRRSRGHWGGENPHDRVSLDGSTRRLSGEILHYTYRDLGHHLEVINLFSRISADAKRARGVRFSTFRLFIHPPAKFFKAYFLKGGFLDGVAGFMVAVMGAYSVFVKYCKLWELSRVEKA
ncbi:MAG: glycosyltransferase family 2 protein [Planctomycetota bacterium]|nr:glycosyltransferase family 2 protein [Planctomycetota bacterium]